MEGIGEFHVDCHDVGVSVDNSVQMNQFVRVIDSSECQHNNSTISYSRSFRK